MPDQALSPKEQLRALLIEYFSEDELDTLCHDLEGDHETVPGKGRGKEVRAREIVTHFARRDRLPAVIDWCLKERPNLSTELTRLRKQFDEPAVFIPEVPIKPAELEPGVEIEERKAPQSIPASITPVKHRVPPLAWAGLAGVLLLAVVLGLAVIRLLTPNLEVGATRVSDKDGMVMVYVPAGDFLMGSTDADSEARGDELPQHKIYLDAFWIDQTEVTNRMFARFVSEIGYKTVAERRGSSWTFNVDAKQWDETAGADWQHPRGPGSDIKGLEQHPVAHMSRDDAIAYCRWAGRQLPTEAQWEKAARGSDGLTYPWGTGGVTGNRLNLADRNLDTRWTDGSVDDGYQFTAPVATYEAGASPYGALDMAGNVWEWVSDWYSDKYYANAVARNPLGPNSGDKGVMRSGSWGDHRRDVRAAARISRPPTSTYDYAGFRCVRPL